jgi:uracil-DNA glycosylase
MDIARIDKLPLPVCWQVVDEDTLEEISNIIENDEKETKLTCRPERQFIFRALWMTPLDRVKVVILGQDPYYNTDKKGRPNANGLAFSVFKGQEIPQSLANIYKELEDDIPGFKIPDHGDLSYWAAQGVLLLNTSLTVLPSKEYANRHNDRKVWTEFSISIIEAIKRTNKKCVYIIWGNPAKDFAKNHIKKNSYTIEGAHPVARGNAFFGSKYFSRCNDMLIKDGEKPIDWQV